MSPLIASLAAFTAAAALLTVTPGLDTAMVLRATTAEGPKGGVAAAGGICLGLLVWGLAAAFGLTAVLSASRLAFTALKWLGAAYLVFLGVKLLGAPRRAVTLGSPTTAGPRRWTGAFRRGLGSNLLNPKIGVFYVTFLPQFVPPGYSVAGVALLLAGVHTVLSLLWLSLLVALTAPLSRLLLRPAVVKTLDRLTGAVFVGFGVRLALTEM